MKNKLIKTLVYIMIAGIVCASLSSCSTSTPEYANLFEETVRKNGDTVRELMFEFDEDLNGNSDFPSFYSGSYLSYSSDGNVNGMVFSLVDSSVSHEFVDMMNSQKDIEYITFEYVRYSYNDLYEIQSKISDLMADAYSKSELFSYIASCAMDMKNNCIVIEIIQLNDEKKHQVLEAFHDIFSEALNKTQSNNTSSDFDESVSNLVMFTNTDKRLQFELGEYK